MSNESDLIIITRQTNGQYLYFNPNEENEIATTFIFFVRITILHKYYIKRESEYFFVKNFRF
ncbi:hypothetical protein JG677_08430 [Campylobacter sp. TTU-622]|uniref:hypothetical protein n=1 Tax=Campylobacter sp. TTU-622 TaxID=2800583 RepID=UPI001905DBF5|nr:hypothetical protein [Campylobacter sp. TTU-622]MBK1974067.1 hypothetical protein [Campylobacter sp. TTU-622]